MNYNLNLIEYNYIFNKYSFLNQFPINHVVCSVKHENAHPICCRLFIYAID